MSSSAGLPVPCAFTLIRFKKKKILLQVPEIPKKIPEEKRPVPRKEEAPSPKGIIRPFYKSCLLQGRASRQRWLGSFRCRGAAWVGVLCAGLPWESVRALNVRNVSKVPAPPKKPVPEEIVPAPTPKKAPPRGRIDVSLLETSSLVRAWVLALSVESVSVLPLLVSFLRDFRRRVLGVCNFLCPLCS